MLTNEWREEAFKRFPELHEKFEDADTPYLLWFELTDAFEKAYRVEPRNESMIRRVYEYCEWCEKFPRGKSAENDLSTCVAVCFFEHIPEIPEAVKDMPRWFSRDDVVVMKGILSYLVGEAGYDNVLAQFNRHQKDKKKRKR